MDEKIEDSKHGTADEVSGPSGSDDAMEQAHQGHSDSGQGCRPGAGPRKRRRQKRKWKPYRELSWEEKRQQEERETKRANAKREELVAAGHPIAPYNTTQFLMDDHKQGTPDLHDAGEDSLDVKYNATSARSNNNHGGGLRNYILEDFSHTYADIHAEHLQTLSKADLIAEYLQMETKVEKLESKVKECQAKHKEPAAADSVCMLIERIGELQKQNGRLLEENMLLKSKAPLCQS